MRAETSRNDVHPKTTCAVVLLVLGVLLSTARLIRTTPSPFHWQEDDIAHRSDERFAALKAYLPARGVFGYVGETGNSATPDYYLAQYALAPRIIERSTNHDWIIGNFPTSAAIPASTHLKLVRDFGGGVLLLSHEDAK